MTFLFQRFCGHQQKKGEFQQQKKGGDEHVRDQRQKAENVKESDWPQQEKNVVCLFVCIRNAFYMKSLGKSFV